MLRYGLPALAALVLITTSLIPDDAFARRREHLETALQD
jgi:hypothetical protein